ncbi:MAG: winged helix-turn-helix domain-containing protein [Euryarchaeota archaeon]|nr:winged helix-turn-helix domain-containing protein [Euryarchaeota archaeon]
MSKMISTVTSSEKRKNLLIYLLDGPKSLEEIRTSLKVTSSGMIPQIRKMEDQKLVRSEGKRYVLTDVGTVIAEVLNSFINTTDIIEKYLDFWSSHNINAIPPHLLKRIYELGNCSLIETKLSEIHEPHKDFLENISRSRKIMGISPIFHSSYPSLFLQLARSGADISLLLAGEVYDRLNNEYKDILDEFLRISTTRLYVSKEDIKLASVITDRYFNMSLFFKNGDYDPLRDIVSLDPSANKWGEEMFNHFLKNSTVIKGE